MKETVLHLALKNHRMVKVDHLALIELLLKNGADPDIEGESGGPTMFGTAWDYLEMTKDEQLIWTFKQAHAKYSNRKETNLEDFDKSEDENEIVLSESDFKEFRRVKVIGQGGFGTVYKYTNGKHDLAVKEIANLAPNSENRLKDEIAAMKKLSGHRNILSIYHHFTDNETDSMLIFTDLCDFDLSGFCAENGLLSPSQAYDCIGQTSDGLRHIHAHKIIHRDLKPQNILVKICGEGRKRYKITDFGLAKVKEDFERTSQVSLSAVGTRAFMAPEVIVSKWNELSHVPKGYPFAVDIFSLGVIFYWLIKGEVPFKEAELGSDEFDPTEVVVNNVQKKELQKLLLRMLRKEPKERPNADQIVFSVTLFADQ